MLQDIDYVLNKLDWMRHRRIWPNGLRHLWTDAFGLVLLVSLYRKLGDLRYLRGRGRARALPETGHSDRRGPRPRRPIFPLPGDWLYALGRLGEIRPEYRVRAIALARDVHSALVIPDVGVIWKMREDLSGPYPGYGLGAIDAFDGYIVYRLLDADALEPEIAEMKRLIDRDAEALDIDGGHDAYHG
jgi:hypothetical protein